jgi:hypothetical protein
MKSKRSVIMPYPVYVDKAREAAKNYIDPIVESAWNLTKRTAQVALCIFACTSFVVGLSLLIQAYTSVAVPTYFAQCLVTEAVLPVSGSCLIFGFVIAVVEKCFEEFNKNSPQQPQA